MFDQAQVEKGKIIAILMYIFPILFFLPLVSEDFKTDYLKFHANNALLILILYVIAAILTVILIGILVYVFAWIFVILGLISAVQGTNKPLPIIGGIVLMK